MRMALHEHGAGTMTAALFTQASYAIDAAMVALKVATDDEHRGLSILEQNRRFPGVFSENITKIGGQRLQCVLRRFIREMIYRERAKTEDKPPTLTHEVIDNAMQIQRKLTLNDTALAQER